MAKPVPAAPVGSSTQPRLCGNPLTCPAPLPDPGRQAGGPDLILGAAAGPSAGQRLNR